MDNPNFRLLWCSSVLCMTPRVMESTILAWLVLELTNSPLQVSYVGALNWAPLLLLGFIGGTLADSFNRKNVFVTTIVFNLLTAIIMTIVLVMNWIEVWHTFILAFITGSSHSLGMASRRSLMHDLVGNENITNAVALDNLGNNTSRIVGPGIAGILIISGGVTVGYIGICILFVVAVLTSIKIKTDHNTDHNLIETNLFKNVIDGLKYVKGQTTLLATVLIACVVNLTITPYVQMTPVMARDVLKVPPDLMGFLLSSHGIGALIGSLVVASVVIHYHGRIYILGSSLALICLFLFSLSETYLFSLIVVLILGIGNAGFNTMQMSLTMLIPRNSKRGASLGAMSLGIGMGPIGMVLTGIVANAIGIATALRINSIVGIICLGLITLLVPSLKQNFSANFDNKNDT